MSFVAIIEVHLVGKLSTMLGSPHSTRGGTRRLVIIRDGPGSCLEFSPSRIDIIHSGQISLAVTPA